jgi:hypothetical protein
LLDEPGVPVNPQSALLSKEYFMSSLSGPRSSNSENRRNNKLRKEIAEFWSALRFEELGPRVWEVLEPMERQVMDCLFKDRPLIKMAESLTAKAMRFLANRPSS